MTFTYHLFTPYVLRWNVLDGHLQDRIQIIWSVLLDDEVRVNAWQSVYYEELKDNTEVRTVPQGADAGVF